MFDLSKSAILNIGILNRLFSKRLDNELKDITVCQYLTLYIINKFNATSISRVNSIYKGDRSTTSRGVFHLEKLGYIRREINKNGCIRLFEVTELGRKVLEENEEIVNKCESFFSENDKEVLNSLVNKQGGSNLNA